MDDDPESDDTPTDRPREITFGEMLSPEVSKKQFILSSVKSSRRIVFLVIV